MGGRFLSTLTLAACILLAIEIATATALAATALARHQSQQGTRDELRRLARELGLTDLALSAGTSYTRHPSQADIFAPHSEHPAAIEHFPAGSIIAPPPTSPSDEAPIFETGPP